MLELQACANKSGLEIFIHVHRYILLYYSKCWVHHGILNYPILNVYCYSFTYLFFAVLESYILDLAYNWKELNLYAIALTPSFSPFHQPSVLFYVVVWDMVSLCVVLELYTETILVLNTEISSLCLLSARITGICEHIQQILVVLVVSFVSLGLVVEAWSYSIVQAILDLDMFTLVLKLWSF